MVSEVLVTEIKPIMMANASKESMSKVKGRRMARPTRPPKPGIAPNAKPISTPMNRYPSRLGTRRFSNATVAASNIETPFCP